MREIFICGVVKSHFGIGGSLNVSIVYGLMCKSILCIFLYFHSSTTTIVLVDVPAAIINQRPYFTVGSQDKIFVSEGVLPDSVVYRIPVSRTSLYSISTSCSV